MKILWVTPQLPCLRSGGQVRQYHLLKYLCQKHRVTVLSLVQEAELEELQPLRQLGAEVVAEPFTPLPPPGLWRNRLCSWSQLLFDSWPHYARVYPLDGLRRRMGEILTQRSPDIIQIEYLFLAPLGQAVNGLPWILTEHDIEYKKFARQVKLMAAPTRRLAGWIEIQKLRRWEKMWIQRSPACIAMSELDAAELWEMVLDTPMFVAPNGADVAHFTPPPGEANNQRANLLFFGNLGHEPNADAVKYFCYEIFPHIRSRRPEIMLTIIGVHARPDVVTLGDLPGVHYIGFVDDIRPYLWHTAVCVVPLRIGGGTRLRILEALAAGCSVVSTTIGAEGLALYDGQHLTIADDPTAFAQAVMTLLADPNQRHRLATAGRQAVAELYDWRIIAPQLEAAYNSVLEAKHK